MTMHLRRVGSKEKLDILSKESTDSMESIELKQHQQRSRQSKSSKSSASVTITAFIFIGAFLLLSSTMTLPRKRSLLEKNTVSSFRTNQSQHHSVVNVVHNQPSTQPKDPIVSDSEATTSDVTPTTIETARTDKPTILIHIGPPKTGTTTLQCHLGLNFAKMIQQDNYYYMGTWHAPLCGLPSNYSIPGFGMGIRGMLLNCYAPHINDECDKDQRWQAFGREIQRHYGQGHNLIVSDEMFHHHFQREDVQRLGSLLKSWNVKILYTYRHFYSSVPSMYHQLNDPYATQEGMANAVEKTIWPNEGGYRIQSFRQSNTFDIQDDMTRFSYWVQEFGTVHVFNMEQHNGAGYLPSFLCTMMPELKASWSCEDNAIGSTPESSSDSTTRNDNGSDKKFLHYDMLAVAAKDAGWLDGTSLTRVEVRDAIQHHCEEKGWTGNSNFVWDCLSDQEMETFLKASLDEAKMMQEYFPIRPDWQLLESEIRTGFAKHAERKKFCSIDTETSLEVGQWRTFFLTLVKQGSPVQWDETVAHVAS